MNQTILLVIIAIGAVLLLVAFVSVRRPGPPPPERKLEAPPREAQPPGGEAGPEAPPAEPETAPPVAQEPAVTAPPPELEAPVEAPPEPEVPPEAPRVSRLSAGLAKTKQALGRSLSGIVQRDKLTDEDWDDVEAALISADVGVKATTALVDALRESKPKAAELPKVLQQRLVGILERGDRALSIDGTRPAVWLVTGVNGVGKTTTIAKLANRLKGEGRSVVLAAADTFRAAAIDQLGTWADRIGIHMVRHNEGSDPGAVVFDAIEHAKAKGADVLIVDTAGRLHTKSNLMEELKKVRRIAEREAGAVAETLLVLDATVGQNAISQARTFQEAVEVTGVVLAKLDGSAKGGIVVAIQDELRIPVKAVGLGEQMEDLEPFEPEAFAAALVEGL
ncbi:MAG: signal recognition particle-docking protein FtsY [Actinomycetota bacterium]